MNRRLIYLLIILILVFIMAHPVPTTADGPIGGRFVIQNQVATTEQRPSVAYNSQLDEYLVVWDENSHVWGKFIDADGRASRASFQISSSIGVTPDVAYNSADNEYIVVWAPCGTSSVCGLILSATGSPLTTEFTIATGYVIPPGDAGISYGSPSVAYSSSSNRYLAVYSSHFYNWLDSSNEIYARGYNAEGTAEATQFPVAEETTDETNIMPDVAHNPSRSEFLVVWERLQGGDSDVYGRRVEEIGDMGTLGLEFPIADLISGDEVDPAVGALPSVPNEGYYLVA